MELMQEEVKGYCDSREEEEEEEATEEIITREENSSRLLHQHQDVAGSNFIINHHRHHHQNHHQHTTKQLDFMDLSLATNKDNTVEANFQGSGIGVGGGASSSGVYAHHHQQQQQHHASGDTNNGNNNNPQQQQPAEKEHMFDKVVTPSDVGKLNRLVIPKQHAEKYFPLDSSSNEKGLLLNFEDRNGKLWRFRYSYWNSSQSYVMTKGWSRFVKEKKLDAGDIVSFQRGVGEMYRHRLYIDWRRRPDHHHHHGHGPDPSTTLFTPLFLPNQPHLMSIRWGATSAGRLYSLPSPTPPTRHHDHLQQHHLNYNNIMYHHQQQYPFHHQSGNGTHHYTNYHEMSNTNSGSGSVFYLRSTPPSMPMVDHQTLNARQQQQQEGGNVSLSPMIIDSVPVAHNHHHHYHGGKSGSSNSPSTAGKRLRLFGVNMECASSTSDQDPKCFSLLSSSSSQVTMANSNSPLHSSSLPSPLQLLREDTTTLSSSPSSTRFGDQRGEASMLFDLDPSLQYRQ